MQCAITNSIDEHIHIFIFTCSSTGPGWAKQARPNGSQAQLGQMGPIGPRPNWAKQAQQVPCPTGPNGPNGYWPGPTGPNGPCHILCTYVSIHDAQCMYRLLACNENIKLYIYIYIERERERHLHIVYTLKGRCFLKGQHTVLMCTNKAVDTDRMLWERGWVGGDTGDIARQYWNSLRTHTLGDHMQIIRTS